MIRAAMGRRIWASLAILSAMSCSPSEPLTMPALQSGGSALLLYVDFSGTELGLYGINETHPPPAFSRHQQDRVFFLNYPRSLKELGLNAGAIQAADPGEETRPFPQGFEASELDLEAQWRSLSAEDLAPILENFKLPSAGGSACEDAGGCFKYTDSGLFCAQPCDVDSSISDPAPPMPPAQRQVLDCPMGWSKDLGEGNLKPHCAAPPRRICPADQVQYASSSICQPLGASCPSDKWPTDLPATGNLYYVDASAAAGGDGSIDNPFSTIQSAYNAASDDDTLVLAQGEYDQRLYINKDISIIGACAQQTIISSSSSYVLSIRANVTLRNLQIRRPNQGSRTQTLYVQSSGSLDGEGLIVDGGYWGVSLLGGGILRKTLVRNSYYGIYARNPEKPFTGHQLVLDNQTKAAIYLNTDQQADLNDIVISNLQRPSDSNSYGIYARKARIVARQVFTERNLGHGAALWEGTTATISGSLFTEGLGTNLTYGVDLNQSHLYLNNSSIFDQTAGGIWTLSTSQLQLHNVLIQRNQGRGIQINSGGELNAEKLTIADQERYGIWLYQSKARIQDLHLSHVISTGPENSTLGILSEGGDLTLRRATISEIQGDGIGSQRSRDSKEPKIDLADVDIRHLRNKTDRDGLPPSVTASRGTAIGTAIGVSRLARVSIQDTDGYGVWFISPSTEVKHDDEASDLNIEGTRYPGISVARGSFIGRRVAIKNARSRAVYSFGTRVSLSDLKVNTVNPLGGTKHAGSALYCLPDAYHITNYFPGSFTLDRFQISSFGHAGIYLGKYCEVQMNNGLISQGNFGVDASVGGFDLSTLESNNVAYSSLKEVVNTVPTPE